MAKKQPQPDQQPSDAAPTHIVVTSSQEGFRRAGRAWSKTPTKIDVTELTQEQLDSILREPMLTVEFVRD